MPSSHPNRRDQLTTAATTLFAAHGFSGVSIREIATAVGITEPALYRHFPSKASLIDEVLAQAALRLSPGYALDHLCSETDPEPLLRGLAQHLLTTFSTHHDSVRLLLYAALTGHEQARSVYATSRGQYAIWLTEQLHRMGDQGFIAEINPEITARCFVGMVFECAMGQTLWRGLQSGAHYPPDRIIANNVPIYARGLRRADRHTPN